MLGRQKHTQRIYFDQVHEIVGFGLPKRRITADSCVGEEHIQTPIGGECVSDDGLNVRLRRGIEGARVDFDGGVERVEFARVEGEVGSVKVAQVDCAGAITRKLVGGCATDADYGVCTWGAVVLVFG